MNFVFISPNFPESYRWFCIRLRENGVNVLGVGDARYQELHPQLREALTEYYRVDSLQDYGQMIRALGYFTGRYGQDRLGGEQQRVLAGTGRRCCAPISTLQPAGNPMRSRSTRASSL